MVNEIIISQFKCIFIQLAFFSLFGTKPFRNPLHRATKSPNLSINWPTHKLFLPFIYNTYVSVARSFLVRIHCIGLYGYTPIAIIENPNANPFAPINQLGARAHDLFRTGKPPRGHHLWNNTFIIILY